MTRPTSDVACAFDEHYAAEQLRRSRHPLRRLVKGFYLRSVLALIRGPTIDYGCGAGQLLARLPPGSVGLEVNPHLIAAHRSAGLSVRQWQLSHDGFDLPSLESGRYQTLVILHVLEHLPDPTASLDRMLQACSRLGVTRVIAIVPGELGFASDATHRTFINARYIVDHGWQCLAGYELRQSRYFPLPWEGGGRLFVYNEMQLVFDRSEQATPRT
jgi:SAM-dependent methyltransferase